MLLTERTVAQLTGNAGLWLQPLNAAMLRWEISTPERAAMFLAQCAHESAGFQHLTENLHYSAAALLATWPHRFTPDEAVHMAYNEELIAERAYGGRLGNGIEGSGDGFKYRGRGIIQLTGRENYRKAGQAIGVDLELRPEMALGPVTACQVAGWFWQTRGCNALADAGDFEGITRKINGGLNGLADRKARLVAVRALLADQAGTQPAAPIEDRSTEYVAPAAQPTTRKPMEPFALVGMLTSLFAPAIRAKVDKVFGTEVGKPLADNLLALAQTATGKSDPLEAVAVARQDPAIVAKLEASATEWLAQVAPLLDKIDAYERGQRELDMESADRAGDRGRKDAVDLAPTIVLYMFAIVAGVLVFLCMVMGVQAWFLPSHEPTTAMLTLVGPLLGGIFGSLATIVAYRFGEKRNSSAAEASQAIAYTLAKRAQ